MVARMDEPEIAVVGTKGQIVIPQKIRRELRIDPKTRIAFFTRGNKLVLAKVELPTLEDELKSLFREIDERYKGKRKPSERQILDAVYSVRHGRRRD